MKEVEDLVGGKRGGWGRGWKRRRWKRGGGGRKGTEERWAR